MKLLRAMLLVGRHAFASVFASKRLLFLGFLCALPPLVNLVVLQQAADVRFEYWVGTVLFGYFHVVAGFGALFLGAAVLGDEIEGRTITYLFTRPVPREVFFVARLLGHVLAYSLLIAASLWLFTSMLADRIELGGALLGGTILVTCAGFAVYAAILAGLRLITDKAIYVGFLFGAAIEFGLSKASASGLSKWSVWHHMVVIEWRLADRSFGGASEALSGLRPEETLGGAATTLAVTFAVALAFGVVLVRTREIRVPAAVG